MTGPLPPGAPTVFVSADWSKEVGKRSVWIADVRARKVLPAPARPWTLTSLMGLARGYSDAGPVLVGIDAALGVPREYWRLVRDARRSRSFANFVQWLRHLDPVGPFFGTTTDARQWSVDRPWFHVRSGPGGRTAFTEQMDDGFLRDVDRATNANPLFAVGGIPGTVGAGTRSGGAEAIVQGGTPRLVNAPPASCSIPAARPPLHRRPQIRETGPAVGRPEGTPAAPFACSIATGTPRYGTRP